MSYDAGPYVHAAMLSLFGGSAAWAAGKVKAAKLGHVGSAADEGCDAVFLPQACREPKEVPK